MEFFVFNTDSIFIPAKTKLEKVEEIGEFPVVIAFPKTQNFGKIFKVVHYQAKQASQIARIVGDRVEEQKFTLNEAVYRCAEQFMLFAGEQTVRRWRLFIHGRLYGSVIPDNVETHVKIPIPQTGGMMVTTRINQHAICENILYWLDMDQAFYRRFGE